MGLVSGWIDVGMRYWVALNWECLFYLCKESEVVLINRIFGKLNLTSQLCKVTGVTRQYSSLKCVKTANLTGGTHDTTKPSIKSFTTEVSLHQPESTGGASSGLPDFKCVSLHRTNRLLCYSFERNRRARPKLSYHEEPNSKVIPAS